MLKKLFIASLTMFFLSGCTSSKEDVIKIGISTWPGYEPLVLALENNYYEDVQVRIVRFATPTESYRALRDGAVDIAAFTIDEALKYSNLKKNPKIFHILDVSNGADSIMAHPNIKNIDDLKGKNIGLDNSALAHYLLRRALDFSTNTSIEDVTLIPSEIGAQSKAFASGHIDAAVTFEPSKTKLRNVGAHEIFSSKQIPFEVVDVLLAHEATITNHKQSLVKIVNGWFAAIDDINKDPNAAYERMSKFEGISSSEFEMAYKSLIIPTRDEVQSMLKTNNSGLKPAIKKLVTLMTEKELLNGPVDIDALLTDDIVTE